MKNSLKQKKKTIFFTGGHLTCAVSVIQELDQEEFEIIWIGRKHTMEKDSSLSAEFVKIHEEMKIKFVNFLSGKIIRPNNMRNFLELLFNLFIKLPIGFIYSFWLFLKYKPLLVVSFGGYIAVPIVLVSKFFSVKSIVHEQTVTTGTANNLLFKFADKILLAWPNPKIKNAKVIGNPIRKEIFQAKTNFFPINKNLYTIYVTCGNQGAHKINQVIFEILNELLDNFNVFHQTGANTITKDLEKANKLQKKFNKKKGFYHPFGFIYDKRIGEIFSKSDLIISRSGANIVFDILALGKLSILIPIPWSLRNEQFLNAKIVEKTGLAIILEEKNLNSNELKQYIQLSIKNLSLNLSFLKTNLEKSRFEAKKLINLNSQKIFAQHIQKMIK